MDEPSERQEHGELTHRFARAAQAAQELSEILWEALHAELDAPDAERVREISQRLAEVTATLAMLAQFPPRGEASERRVPVSPTPQSSADPSPQQRTAPRAAPDLRLASHPPMSYSMEEPRSVDEPHQPRPQSQPEGPAALQPLPTRAAEQYTFTRLVDERGASAPVESVRFESAPVESAPALATPEIAVRDARSGEGPSAWVSSVGRLLRRHAEDGLPFAVLLVEIVDVARLERACTPHDMHGLVAKVEDALGRGMRGSDHLSRETLGRYWLVAPETNGTGARMLADRLARLVRSSASHRGTPLEVAIGIAICPDDGTEAPALAARADLGVYAARATGRSVAHSDPPGV